jgi:tetratricopeptide (TPR) repeat protein
MRVAFAFALSCAIPAFSQAPAPAPAPPAGGGGGGGQPGGNPGGGGNPFPGGGGRPTQPPTRPQQQEPSFDQMNQQRPIFLSGKVVMDDGTRPPTTVVIERVCGGVNRPEGYTDSKGHFSFQLGQNQHMIMDASQSSVSPFPGTGGGGGRGGMMGGNNVNLERELNGCEIRAVLAGFRSDNVMLAGRRAMDNPDIGTIVLRRLAKVEGFTFSGTSLDAPKDAAKAYDKGSKAAKKKKWDDAEKELRKAVDLYPKYAVAWYELGTVYHQQNNAAQAQDAYTNATKADEKYVNPYAQLARLHGSQGKWPETAEMAAKAIKLNPYFSPEMYYISAVANFNLKKLDVAEEHAREAAKMDAQGRNPRINSLLGVVLAQKEAYPEAAENMRAFLKKVPEGPDADHAKKQLAEIERLMNGAVAAQGTQAAQ